MLQTSHDALDHTGPEMAGLHVRKPDPNEGLSPAVMAGYLRKTNPLAAHCFALEMQARAGWANPSWDAYWADVARLVSCMDSRAAGQSCETLTHGLVHLRYAVTP